MHKLFVELPGRSKVGWYSLLGPPSNSTKRLLRPQRSRRDIFPITPLIYYSMKWEEQCPVCRYSDSIDWNWWRRVAKTAAGNTAAIAKHPRTFSCRQMRKCCSWFQEEGISQIHPCRLWSKHRQAKTAKRPKMMTVKRQSHRLWAHTPCYPRACLALALVLGSASGVACVCVPCVCVVCGWMRIKCLCLFCPPYPLFLTFKQFTWTCDNLA